MKILDILREEAPTQGERRRYSGKVLETGGTSIQGVAAPALRALFKKGNFNGKIIDYGAGKYARNAKFLREQGFEVYAFDPYNGSPEGDGWNETSTHLPDEEFDVGFTSFVLNVVPEYVEKEIIQNLQRLAPVRFHITRNMDIYDMVKKALARGEPLVTNFFFNEFAREDEAEALRNGELSDQTIMEFCEFGVQTSKGFQRIPTCDDYGPSLIRNTANFKVYKD